MELVSKNLHPKNRNRQCIYCLNPLVNEFKADNAGSAIPRGIIKMKRALTIFVMKASAGERRGRLQNFMGRGKSYRYLRWSAEGGKMAKGEKKLDE